MKQRILTKEEIAKESEYWNNPVELPKPTVKKPKYFAYLERTREKDKETKKQ